MTGNNAFSDGFRKGDPLNIIASPSPFQLTYNGVDLTSDDYVSLQFRTLTKDTFVISGAGTSSTSCGLPLVTLNNTRLIQITSGLTNSFTLNGESADTLFWSLENNTGSTFGVYYKPSSSTDSCYHKLNGTATVTGASVGTAALPVIKFAPAGDIGNAASGGALVLTTFGTGAAAPAYATWGNITLYEDAGKAGVSSDMSDALNFGVYSTSAGAYAFKPTSTSTNTQLNYTQAALAGAGLDYSQTVNVDIPFISERGSIVDGYSNDVVSMKIASKVATVSWTLSSAGTTSSDASEITLAEGDSQTVSGVTIMAKSITESVGACTASVNSGAPTCTVDQTGVKAKIVDGGEYKDSVETLEPYKVGKLVVLDSDASASDSVVAVGGPAVNTVTASALQGAAVDFNTDRVVVKEVGKTIVVAGLSADDTLAAADRFIAGIKRQ